MKFNKLMKKALIILVVANGLSHISAAIDDDINSKSGLGLKQYAQGLKRQTAELKQQVAAFSVFENEVVAYASAYKTARDTESEAAQVAAYAPLFEAYKAKARIEAVRVIVAVCPGDEDTVPFLHAEVPVGGDGQPTDNTKAAIITWLEGRIARLTITGATGPKTRSVTSTHLPKDGNRKEFTRFTDGLVNYIASNIWIDIHELRAIGVDKERRFLINFVDASLLKNLCDLNPNMDLKNRIRDAILYT